MPTLPFPPARTTRRGSLFLVPSLLLLTAGTLTAEARLDKAAAQWLREVHLLILPDEEALFRTLPGEDRKEFQRIFWARRDPDPRTPKNEMQDAISQARARADDLFGSRTERGSETGCGQVFLLLGEPLEVQGRELKERFSSLREMKEGARRPETWTYRSRADDPVVFTGGELRISFDEDCRFSEGGRVLEDLRRVAQARITRRDLDYARGPDGRLVPLDERLRSRDKPASLAVLGSDRSDFTLALEPKLLLRTQGGLAYAAGLARFEGGGTRVTGTVAVQALGPDGSPAASGERAFAAIPEPDGATLAAYAVSLKPGRYTLRVGVLLSDGRASVLPLPIDVPDFDAPGLKVSPLVLYPDEPARPAEPDDPFGALTLGPLRLRPRFGNAFRTADALQVVAVLTGGQPDATSHKPALRARFVVLKAGTPVAKGAEDVFDTALAVASVGPIPLASYGPGAYVVRLEATDVVAGTTVAQDAAFEVRP